MILLKDSICGDIAQTGNNETQLMEFGKVFLERKLWINFLYRLHVKDNIENATILKFKGKLENSTKEIKELKGTEIYYQIAFLVISIIELLFVI